MFVDEITEIVPGELARGRWHLTGDEAFFEGHFPGRPTLPGVLMCEAIAQLGAVAVLADERYAGRLPLFGGIDKARFRQQVGPGDTLELECEMTRLAARAGRGSGRALLAGREYRTGEHRTGESFQQAARLLAAECQLMFVIA